MGRGYEAGDEPVPGYRLEKFLGEGAFGQVWRAVAPGGTETALKILSLSGRQGLKEFRALRLVKGLRHPNLVPIFAYWLKDDTGHVLDETAANSAEVEHRQKSADMSDATTLIVELRDSARPVELLIAMGLGEQDLSRRLEECRQQGLPAIPVEELLSYMDDAARAIDYLNDPRLVRGSQGVAVQHCDIKPFNIMIVGGAAQVCDFGLARMLGDVRKTATAAGSIAYVAPECLTNNEPSATTDQYSLAVTYYELRTGKLPYRSENFADVTNAVLKGELELKLLPPAEQAVIGRATSRDPTRRYRSTTEMVQALHRAAGESNSTHSASAPQKSGGRRGVRAVAWLAVIAAACGIGWYTWGARAGQWWNDFKLADGQNPPVAQPEPAEPPPPPIVRSTPVVETPPAPAKPKTAAAAVVAPPQAKPRKPVALARGRTLFEQGKFEEAIAALTEAIESSPKPPAEALLLRGTAYLEESKYDEAVADLSRAREIDPGDTRALSRRATALLRQGKDQAAIEDFTRAIEAQPDARDYIGRAMAYWTAGRNADAIADLSQSLSMAPDSSDAHFKRGLVYLDQQQWLLAKQDFAAALKGDPENPDLLSNYARLLATAPEADVRQGTLAVALATKACHLSSESNSECFDTLAAAYAEAGQFDEAIRAAETAVSREHDPATKQEYTARLVLYHAKRPYHLEP